MSETVEDFRIEQVGGLPDVPAFEWIVARQARRLSQRGLARVAMHAQRR